MSELTDDRLAEIRAELDEVETELGHAEAQYNHAALKALSAGKNLLAEVERLRGELAEHREDAKFQAEGLREENDRHRAALTDLVLAVDCLRCGRIKASEVHL